MDRRRNRIGDELFGTYCKIASGSRNEKYVYRIISKDRSRMWSDVPLTYTKVYHPNVHERSEEVVYVVIDEEISDKSKVVGVRLKDVELIGGEI